ncbi:disease resistance protein RGA2-like [Phragmites australis]|uniref:disease resistance protein RGA2-like n=1 Tax=Phragmites australis TaxID=29695 RepID=UPI002D78E3C0|nr:disease resistance protein RGA2-like [Phragmites australis]
MESVAQEPKPPLNLAVGLAHPMKRSQAHTAHANNVTTHHRVDHDGYALVRSSWSFPLSRLTGPAKRLCTVAAGTTVGHDDGVDQLSVVLARLEDATEDMKEFILVLACCPRIQRRPISNFFSEDKFMFGRLVEREQIISFLLKPGSNLDILPIVGGPEVGKGTIVKCVCSDERVRDHFSFILYSYGSLLEERCIEDMLGTLRRGGHVLHESSVSGHGRHLLVIKNTYEVVINEAVWVSLCASLRSTAPGSKIIVISENDRIADLGTVVAMRVKPLPREEYWYFFRSLAFGGNDPEEHPELAVLGRKIAAALHGSFFGAKVLVGLLRMNLNAQFWCAVLNVVQSFHASLRGDDDHFSKICVAKIALETLPVPLRLKSACKTGVASELPAMTIQELLHSAGVPHQEEIRIMLWESAYMPNYRYTVVCEKVEKRPSAPIERKRRARQQQIDQ